MTVSVVFETRQSSANDGKIVATFTQPAGPASSWECKFGVVSPTGATLLDADDSTITVLQGQTDTIEVDIPLTSDGEYLEGEYALTIYYNNTLALPGGEVLIETGYTYCAHNSPDHATSDVIALTSELDCLSRTISGEDTSDYTDITRLTRALTVTPPVIAATSPTTTGGATVSAPVTWTNVPYQVSLDVSFEYDSATVSGMTIISRGSALIYQNLDVTCQATACDHVKCLISRFRAYKRKAKFGWGSLSAEERLEFEYNAALVNLAVLARVECADVDTMNELLAEAAGNLDCDCGCADPTSPAPLPTNAVSAAISTDLGYTHDGDGDLTITSSTGGDVELPVATNTLDGLMAASDKLALTDALADITTLESSMSGLTAAVSGIDGVVISNGAGNPTIDIDDSATYYRIHATAGHVTVNLDTMPIGRLVILSLYKEPARALSLSTTLTTLPTGNTSNVSASLPAVPNSINLTILLIRTDATHLYATVLSSSIVTS